MFKFPPRYVNKKYMKGTKDIFRKGSVMTVLIATLLIVAASSVVSLMMYNHYYAEGMIELYQGKAEDDSAMVSEIIMKEISMLRVHANTFGSDNNTANAISHFIMEPDNTLYQTQLRSHSSDVVNELQLLFSSLLDSSAIISGGELFSNYQLYPKYDDGSREFIESLYSSDDAAFMSVMNEMENPLFYPSGKVFPVIFRYEIFGKSPAFLVAFISSRKLANQIAEAYLTYFDGIEITDSSGSVIYSVGMPEDEKGYTITEENFNLTGWHLSIARNNSTYTEWMKRLFVIEAGLLILIGAITSGLILVFYRSFTEPLRALMRRMVENSKKREYLHATYNSDNEIGTLTKCYNEVIDDVEDLVMALNGKISELEEEKKQREWEEEQKRLAEIKALQAQINPHFLYNALNSIVWITTDNGDTEAAEFTLRLANFYHTGLSRGDEFIALEKELNHASDYLWLQKHRYQELSGSLHADPEIKGMMVPKIILQPLIENAIYHGLKPSEKHWRIVIRAYRKDDNCILSVYDNGVGIPPKRLQMLNKNLSAGIVDSSSGYGIYNINNRIKLTYGNEYGLAIFSEEGHYTLSVVTLPIEKEEKHEYSHTR